MWENTTFSVSSLSIFCQCIPCVTTCKKVQYPKKCGVYNDLNKFVRFYYFDCSDDAKNAK